MNITNQRPGEVTALNGTLIRWGANNWAWIDNTPAPAVRDITPSEYYNFRCRTCGKSELTGKPATYVEVPVASAQKEPELAWVLNSDYDRDLSGDHVGQRVIHGDGRMTRAYADPRTGETTGAKVIPEVILVPVERWDEWSKGTAIGAAWDKPHEAAILAKSASLRAGQGPATGEQVAPLPEAPAKRGGMLR